MKISRISSDFNCFRSTDEPPKAQMFGGPAKKPSPVQTLTSTITEMAKVIATPQQSREQASTSGPVGISPGKMANLRSTYLQQLRDLHALLESGAIDEREFREQKDPILEQLKKYSPTT